MFSHQKLDVYHKAVAIAADLARLATDWDKRHSVVDHLSRAAESVGLNLTESVRLSSVPAKECTIDYAVGSALECAACLDIAVVKELLGAERGYGQKLEDRSRFLNVAEAAAVKTATYLDLCQHEEGLNQTQARAGFERLEQVARMLSGFAVEYPAA
jgi:four helix bundle protein